MMITSSSSFSLLSLSLLFFAHYHGGATAQNLIHDTCKTCSQEDPNVKFNFCTAALQAAPGSQCAALRGLGKISIGLIWNNVTDTRCHIKQLLKNKTLEPYVKECLSDCFDLYSDSMLSLKNAMKHYDSRRYGDANIELSSVMDAATTCEDGFEEKKESVVSPLTERNMNTFELSAMALSILHMFQTGSSQ
ncbi:hypothetical protein U1Q18_035964 [Sarracenia purpurea var. burkii]